MQIKGRKGSIETAHADLCNVWLLGTKNKVFHVLHVRGNRHNCYPELMAGAEQITSLPCGSGREPAYAVISILAKEIQAMRNLTACFLAVVCSAGLYAQTATPPPAHPAKQPDSKAEAVRLTLEQKVQELQEQLQQRDAGLQQLQKELKDIENALSQTQSKAESSGSKSEQNAAKITQLQDKVTVLATNEKSAADLVQSDEKRIGEAENPAQLKFRGVTLTPGGYFSAVSLYRTHNMNSDTSTNFGAIPLSGSMNSNLSETEFSARQSRISLRVDSAVHGMKAMGYFEMDFLGVGQSGANETQSNGFSPRLRLAFANIDTPHGISVAAGQNWSLLQTTRRAIDPLAEMLPATIDNSYLSGFSYARQDSVRVVKQLGNRAWAGFAVENPQMVLSYQCAAGIKASAISACPTIVSTQSATGTAVGSPVIGFQNGSQTSATSPNGFAQGSVPSSNMAPDLVVKLAVEPGWGHYEIKAVGKVFRDRVYPAFYSATTPAAQALHAFNATAEGAGLGFGMALPVVKNKVDFVAQGLGGRGIGRYSTSSGSDVTLRPDGTIVPILGYQSMAGVETHPSTKLDLYVYGGGEYYQRTMYVSTTPLFGGTASTGGTTPIAVGYGIPYINDSQCSLELGSTNSGTTNQPSCSSPNRDIWEVTPGFWYRFWKGSGGMLQFGGSYAYVERKLWSGLNGSNPSSGAVVNAGGIENIVMLAFRYYLP